MKVFLCYLLALSAFHLLGTFGELRKASRQYLLATYYAVAIIYGLVFYFALYFLYWGIPCAQ